MTRPLTVGLLAVACLLGTFASAAQSPTGFLDRRIAIGGETFRYQVYVPSDYTAAKAWPLVVSLHGNGRQGSDGMLPTGADFANHIREGHAPFPAIVVFPQGKMGTRWFYPQMEELVMAVLDRTIAEFRVDPARVYLQGYSMGAGGAYRIACRWPGRFAAVVAVAGRVEPGENYTAEEMEIDRKANPALAAQDPFAALAAGLRKQPMWIFHGDADAVVGVDQSRKLYAASKALGAPVKYTELPGADHNTAPALAYADAELFLWLWSQRLGLPAAPPAPAAPPVTFMPSARILEQVRAAPEVSPGLRRVALAETPDYSANVLRRTAVGLAEVHAEVADVWYVVEGRGTLVTGGSLVDGVDTGPGERRGPSVAGGEPRPVGPGDVVTIAAGVPHWLSRIEGEIVYVVVKVDASPR